MFFTEIVYNSGLNLKKSVQHAGAGYHHYNRQFIQPQPTCQQPTANNNSGLNLKKVPTCRRRLPDSQQPTANSNNQQQQRHAAATVCIIFIIYIKEQSVERVYIDNSEISYCIN